MCTQSPWPATGATPPVYTIAVAGHRYRPSCVRNRRGRPQTPLFLCTQSPWPATGTAPPEFAIAVAGHRRYPSCVRIRRGWPQALPLLCSHSPWLATGATPPMFAIANHTAIDLSCRVGKSTYKCLKADLMSLHQHLYYLQYLNFSYERAAIVFITNFGFSAVPR